MKYATCVEALTNGWRSERNNKQFEFLFFERSISYLQSNVIDMCYLISNCQNASSGSGDKPEPLPYFTQSNYAYIILIYDTSWWRFIVPAWAFGLNWPSTYGHQYIW